MVLSTHNSVLSTRINRLYWFQPSPVVLCMQKTTLGLELQASVVPRNDLSFCACTTVCLASELLVSMGPIPHLWFSHSNSALWTRNTSLYGSQTFPVVLCMQNSKFRTRLTSLYGSQTSSAVLSTHNSVLSTKTKRLYWFQTSPLVLCKQNSDFRTRITGFCGSKTPPVDFACKTATSGPE